MIWQAGTLTGMVTDAGSGVPVEGAQLLLQRGGYTLGANSDAAGDYGLLLGQGTYTVTVQAYGYEPWTLAGVDITEDVTTTLDAALTALPTHTLSGVVAEGLPLVPGELIWGQAGVYGTPILATTDPASGAYSTPIAEGSYWMRVLGRGYVPENRTITITGDLVEDFALDPRWTYYVRDSRSACGPAFDWIDATDGTPHYLDFQDFVEITEPSLSPFTFYDTPYDLYYVSSNGFISFGQGYPDPLNPQDVPSMVFPYEGPANNAIYGFEEMLNPANGGQGVVYHKVLDDRTMVVEFHQVEHWFTGFPETFEFILDTETGVILLQYQEVSKPDFASVGVEDEYGLDGVQYSYANSGDITNSLAVAFYPVFGPPPADQAPGGVYGTLSGTVYVTGTATPVPGAVVTATTFLRTLTTTTDAAGRYQFPVICADLYWLQADACGDPGPSVQARLRWPDDVVVNDLFVQPCQVAPLLTKTVSPFECGEITYTLSYANEGEDDLIGAVLVDHLPFGVYYITSTPPGFYDPYDHTLTWTMDLPAGAAGAVTIVGFPIVPPAEGIGAGVGGGTGPIGWPMTNTVTLSWYGGSISASVVFDLVLFDLFLTKTVALTQVVPGELVTYTLAYANHGCDFLIGGALTDALPAEVAYVTSTPPASFQNGVLSWTVHIPGESTGSVTVVGRLSTTAEPGTVVTNTAYLSSWEGFFLLSSDASFLVGQQAGPRYEIYLPLVLRGW
jgi:uncharacterized repeat protein (TIGR01451 family)